MALTRLSNRWSAMSRPKQVTAAGVAIALLLGTAGIAYALWSATGAGDGRSRATTAVEITVIATDGPQDLYPGFTDGDIYFTLDNDNPYPVTFTSATAGAVTSSNPAGCASSNITVDTPISGLSLSVAGNATSGTLAIPDVVSMVLAAPDACQGVSFDIELTLTGAQSS